MKKTQATALQHLDYIDNAAVIWHTKKVSLGAICSFVSMPSSIVAWWFFFVVVASDQDGNKKETEHTQLSDYNLLTILFFFFSENVTHCCLCILQRNNYAYHFVDYFICFSSDCVCVVPYPYSKEITAIPNHSKYLNCSIDDCTISVVCFSMKRCCCLFRICCCHLLSMVQRAAFVFGIQCRP